MADQENTEDTPIENDLDELLRIQFMMINRAQLEIDVLRELLFEKGTISQAEYEQRWLKIRDAKNKEWNDEQERRYWKGRPKQ